MSELHITGFDVIEKLGVGGMATVWKARQKSLDRIVAIKVLSEHFATDASDIQRFQTEAQSAAKLKHPGIIQVYDASFESGQYYFIMEYVAGYTVGDWLRRKGKLSEKDALLVAECVSDALDYAWKTAKIIHCDIKPDNVMVDADGAVKVADLGLARTISAMSGEKEFAEEVLGTPAYISPEQAMGAPDIDCRADIYSLGAMLYHLVTGHMMFEGEPEDKVMDLQVKGHVQDAFDWDPGLSRGMCTMLEKMMAKNRDDRYKDWADFRNDLARVKSRLPLFGSTIAEGASTMSRSTKRQKAVAAPRTEKKKETSERGSPVPLIAAGVGAVLAVVIVVIWALASREPAPVRRATNVTVTPDTLPPTEPDQDALARKEALAKGMFETAQRLYQENPDKYDEAIQRFQTVLHQTRGTKYSLMAEDERKKVEKLREDDIRKTMAELDGKADELSKTDKIKEAIAVYENYSGAMASYTSSLRRKRVALLTERLAREKKEEAERRKQSEQKFKLLVDSVVQALAQGDTASAAASLASAATDPLLAEHSNAVGEIKKVVDGAGSMDQKILASFRAQKGQDVTIQLVTGAKKVLIADIAGNRIIAKQKIGSDLLATVTLSFALSDLAPAERMQRMGPPDLPDVALARGMCEVSAKNYAEARKCFEKTVQVLAEPLVAQLSDMDRKQGDEEAKNALMTIVRMYEISNEPYNLESWMAAAAKKTLANDSAARLAEAITAFRKKYESTAFVVEAEPLLTMLGGKSGKGEEAVIVGPAPRKQKTMSKVESQGHPVAEAWVRRNPALLPEDIGIFVDENEKVVRVEVYSPGVTDIAPAAALKELREFSCGTLPPSYHGTHPVGRVSAISPLRSLPLESVYLGLMSVSDISALSGMKLRELMVPCTDVGDISVTRHMPLEKVDLRGTRVQDISPLKGKQIAELDVSNTRIVDFRPLAGMPLTFLDASGTLIVDLSVLKGMPLKHLSLARTKVSSLTYLSSMQLTHLDLSDTIVRDVTPLRGIGTLDSLYLNNTDVTDINTLSGLKIANLSLSGTGVRDLSSLKSMPLRSLNLAGCQVSDISVLSGKPLEFLDLSSTKTSDLSPLEVGGKLRSLNIRNTQVSDLTPISKIPLSFLDCRGTQVSDFSPLRRMPLDRINIDTVSQVLPVLMSMPKLRYVNGTAWDRVRQIPGKGDRPKRPRHDR